MSELNAPFPWFGGKSRVSPMVWERFGDVKSYVEPFFGSGAVLLGRPGGAQGIETVNDLDGFVANFWRAMRHDPEGVVTYASDPVNENDLHARHVWLVNRRKVLRAMLEADPEWFDVQIAGWWVWGICCWIGSGWCSGKGPWWPDEEMKLVKRPRGDGDGRGVNRQLPDMTPKGTHRRGPNLINWFAELHERMALVRVCSGDWSRLCSHSVLRGGQGGWTHPTGVFLDPPYADTASRRSDLYAHDSLTVAHDVREWAIAHGDDPRMRIALCGYDGEHAMPESWTEVAWKAKGGYASQGTMDGANSRRERIWFSPHCLPVR